MPGLTGRLDRIETEAEVRERIRAELVEECATFLHDLTREAAEELLHELPREHVERMIEVMEAAAARLTEEAGLGEGNDGY